MLVNGFFAHEAQGPVGRAAQAAVRKTAQAGATPARDSSLERGMRNGERGMMRDREDFTTEAPGTQRKSRRQYCFASWRLGASGGWGRTNTELGMRIAK